MHKLEFKVSTGVVNQPFQLTFSRHHIITDLLPKHPIRMHIEYYCIIHSRPFPVPPSLSNYIDRSNFKFDFHIYDMHTQHTETGSEFVAHQ